MSDEKIKAPELFRRFEGTAIELRKQDNVTRLTFAASSEAPVDRWFGTEVLSHEKSAIRLDRAKGGAMPLLFNHNPSDPVGMVDGARVDGGRLMVDAHLFDTVRAIEVASMLTGGLRNVSIGYRLHVVEQETKSEIFRATDWEPYEVSIVTVPADPSVGIGRQSNEYEVRMVRASQPAAAVAAISEGVPMDTSNTAAAGTSAGQPVANDGVKVEQLRITTILNLCRQHKIDEPTRDKWINDGATGDEVAQKILDVIAERTSRNPQPESKIGMTEKETRKYSLWRALGAVADGNWKNAGLELEATRAVAQKLNRVIDANSFFVPFEVQTRPVEQKRDLSVAASGGGYLVETNNVGLVEMLRNRSVALRMGARRLTGLTGNVMIPKQSAAATAYWLANETVAITESQQTFVQIALSPKTAGAYTEISRQLLLQSSPDAEGLVTSDLAAVVALAIDLAVLNGSGATSQPTGIITTAGIGAVSGTTLSYPGVLEFQTDVATANVMPAAGGYVTTPAVASLMMQRQRFTSTDTPLWIGNIWDGAMSGFPAMSSNQMPAANMLFGDWSQVVVAEWGVLEIAVNPQANFAAGIIGIRAMYSMDVGVRLPVAFSLATTIT